MALLGSKGATPKSGRAKSREIPPAIWPHQDEICSYFESCAQFLQGKPGQTTGNLATFVAQKPAQSSCLCVSGRETSESCTGDVLDAGLPLLLESVIGSAESPARRIYSPLLCDYHHLCSSSSVSFVSLSEVSARHRSLVLANTVRNAELSSLGNLS